MGRTMRQIKDATADLQTEIKKSSNEMKKDLNLQGILKETQEDIRRPLDQMVDDLDNAVKYEPLKQKSHLAKTHIIEEATIVEEQPVTQVSQSVELDPVIETEPKPTDNKTIDSKE